MAEAIAVQKRAVNEKAVEFHLSRIPPTGWDDFVMEHPDARLYYLTRWHQMIQEVFGHPTYYLTLHFQNQIVAALPVTLFSSFLFGQLGVSLPFVNYGGPLLAPEVPFQLFEAHLRQLQKQWKVRHIEIRYHEKLETQFPSKTSKVTYLLNLPTTEEELWKSFKSKLRSQIRRPLKEHMFVRRGGIELVDDFYAVFAQNMRDLGTPVYPKKFFRAILEHFPAEAALVVVYSNEEIPVAASFLIQFNEVMEIPWASSLRAYNRFSPNMLLYWESLRFSIERGCQVFDFGRCTPGSGTCRFKKQWGPQVKQLYWYYVLPEGETLPEISPRNPKFELMIKIWQRLPLFLANFLGPKIIRHIPG